MTEYDAKLNIFRQHQYCPNASNHAPTLASKVRGSYQTHEVKKEWFPVGPRPLKDLGAMSINSKS